VARGKEKSQSSGRDGGTLFRLRACTKSRAQNTNERSAGEHNESRVKAPPGPKVRPPPGNLVRPACRQVHDRCSLAYNYIDSSRVTPGELRKAGKSRNALRYLGVLRRRRENRRTDGTSDSE